MIYSSDAFTYNKSGKEFVTEASTLQEFAIPQVYPKIAHRGNMLSIRSEKTQRVAEFVFARCIYQGQFEDKEVVAWCYVPTLETVDKIPTLRDTRVVVLND